MHLCGVVALDCCLCLLEVLDLELELLVESLYLCVRGFEGDEFILDGLILHVDTCYLFTHHFIILHQLFHFVIILSHRQLVPTLHLPNSPLQLFHHHFILLKHILNLVIFPIDNLQLILDPFGFPLLFVELLEEVFETVLLLLEDFVLGD